MRSSERIVGHRVIEAAPLETDDIGPPPFVIGVAGPARLAGCAAVASVEARVRSAISGD